MSKIKSISEVIEELENKIKTGENKLPKGAVTGDEFEEWLRIQKIDISPDDISISTYNPQPGDSNLSIYYEGCIGVKMLHIPTGIEVNSHSEKSQFKNKNACLSKLKEMIYREELNHM